MESTQENQKWQVAEIQLLYKSKVKASERPVITSSKDAYNILKDSWDDNTLELFEQFKVLLLNRANRVLGIIHLSTGGLSGTIADPKLIFAAGLKAAASGIILAHNHPSGNLSPSQADKQLTQRIQDGGRLLEINLLDHIILTRESYFSFADDGFL